MVGTIVNTVCIIAGSVIGATLKRGIKPQYQTALFNAMGLCAFVLGINACVQNMPKSDYPVLFIVSLALGSLIGYILRLSDRFDILAQKLSGKKNGAEADGKRLSEGLSTGILLYFFQPAFRSIFQAASTEYHLIQYSILLNLPKKQNDLYHSF